MSRSRGSIGALVLVLAASAAWPAPTDAQKAGSGTGARHRHPHAARVALDDSLRTIRLVPAELPAASSRAGAVADGRRRAALVVEGTRLFVVDRRGGRTAEVVGVPFEWRPFSDVGWSGGRLVFDRWSSPHAGMHYVLDVTTGRLVAATSFHDEVAER